jgi:hypothetical protein
MSTRSIIARELGSESPMQWEGRYHHWDGYPAGVGATLFDMYNGHFGRFEKDIGGMLEFLIDEHPAGWSTINEADFSKEPGFGSGGPECYCHGDRNEEGCLYTNNSKSFAGAEYCYVINADDHTMAVLERVYEDGSRAVQFFGVDASDVAENVRWKIIAVVNLDGPEPNWKIM